MSKLRKQMNKALIVRGYSDGTRRLYINAVYRLAKYYHRSPDAITTPEIEAYLYYLIKERKLCHSTVNIQVHGLKFFYAMLDHNGQQVPKVIPRGKESQYIPDILSQNEIRQILSHTKKIKYKLIFMIAYGAGLRGAEIVTLRIGDIDSQRMVIHVRNGKGKKDRFALLTPSLLEALRQYWQHYKPGDYLFPHRDQNNKPMSQAAARLVLRQVKQALRITKKGGLHSLRHAFATHLLESGVDLFQIQHLLGHRRISSTTHYLRYSIKLHQQIISPLDRLKLI